MVIINTKPQIKKSLVLIVFTFILMIAPMCGSANNSTTPQKTKTSSAVRYIPDNIVRSAMDASEKFDIPVENILAMIMVENRNFNPTLVHHNKNGTYDMGITQINSSNMSSFKSAGFTDVYNIEQNIAFGTMKLRFAKDAYGDDWHKIYMVYNMGGSGAKRAFNGGVYQTKYSTKALGFVENIYFYISPEMTKELEKKLNNQKDCELPLFYTDGVTPPYDKATYLKRELEELHYNKLIIPSERISISNDYR